MKQQIRLLLLSVVLLSGTAFGNKANDKHQHVQPSEWGVDIGIGYATISNPLNQRDDLHSVLLPQWYYYGERFYMETTDLGYTLFEDERLIFDLVGYVNQDGVLFNTDNNPVSYLEISKLVPNAGLPMSTGAIDFPDIERRFSYMLGGQIMLMTHWLDGRFVWGKDVSAGHNGEEITLALEKRYGWQDWQVNWELGVIGKTQALNNYYYGLRAEEAARRADVDVTDKLLKDYYAKVAVAYRVSDNWSAVASWQYTRKAGALTISPLLEKRSYVAGFIGMNYHF